MEITEYTKYRALATATMWNESRDHFGGGNKVETAEQRHCIEQNAGNITTMLAVEGDKVIGYCGLSEYREDTGALYIPLLNAHPNYLGRGVGKALVLEAVKRTYETGWPRLDLYTWPGNTKAVPLYKRCGFFWEDREDSTHLMNFIPLVLMHPMLKPFLTLENWYDALRQQLVIQPDREKQNGFSVFTYAFKVGENRMHVGIEHSARTIYKIETDSYKVEWLLPSKHLFVQEEYEATLVVENKTEKQLHVEAKGVTEDQLNIPFHIDAFVKGRREFHLPFLIEKNERDKPISEWKTHPSSILPLKLNGVECPLACGFAVKKPLKLRTYVEDAKALLKRGKGEVAIQVVNQQNEAVKAKIELLNTVLVSPVEHVKKIDLKALETGVVVYPILFKQSGVEELTVRIHLTKTNGDSVLETKLPLFIEGENGFGSYEDEETLVCTNGRTKLIFDKETFSVYLKSARGQSPWKLLYPAFGEPLNNELANKGWHSLQVETNENMLEAKAVYSLLNGAAKGTISYFWHQNQTIDVEMIIENTSKQKIELNHFVLPMEFYPEAVSIPTAQKLHEVGQVNRLTMNELPLEKRSEPWLFMEWENHSLGIKTDNGAEWLEIDHDLGLRWTLEALEQGEMSQPFTLKLYPNTFSSSASFAKFEGFTKRRQKQRFARFADHGFLQTDKAVGIKLETGKKEADNGYVFIQTNEEVSYPFAMDSGEVSLSHPIKARAGLGVTPFRIRYEGRYYEKTRVLHGIHVGNEEVDCRLEEENGLETHVVSNEFLTFKASEAFYPSIYSLKTKREWFDHLHPTAGPKSWWNPWGGGMMTTLGNLQLRTVMEQEREVSFVEMFDQWGHKWTGIKVSVQFGKHREWSGVELNQYFVTLPGASVLAHVNELKNGPELIEDKNWLTACFLSGRHLSVYPSHSENECFKPNGGHFELKGLELASINRLYARETDETLLVISQSETENREYYENKDVFVYMSKEPIDKWPNGNRVMSNPQLFVWTDGFPSSDGWDWLKNVELKEEIKD